MLLEYVVKWVFGCVKLEDTNVVVVLTSKKMSTIGKDDFTAVLDIANVFIRNKRVFKDVHHSDSIGETNDDVKT